MILPQRSLKYEVWPICQPPAFVNNFFFLTELCLLSFTRVSSIAAFLPPQQLGSCNNTMAHRTNKIYYLSFQEKCPTPDLRPLKPDTATEDIPSEEKKLMKTDRTWLNHKFQLT